MSDQTCPSFYVSGDPTVDWMLAVPTGAGDALEAGYAWARTLSIQLVAQPGGAALLRALLERVAAKTGFSVTGVGLPPVALSDPRSALVARSFAVWQPFPARVDERELAWRMHRFLGQQPAELGALAPPPSPLIPPAVIAFDDANLGFRRQPAWWDALDPGTSAPAHVVVKMVSPLGQGEFWERLIDRYADRLTFYCAVTDLRREHAPVGQPLSWERLGSEVVETIRARTDLGRAARIVVSLGYAGAVVWTRDAAPVLIFDPHHQEGDWERSRPGIAVGLGTCVAAALTTAAAKPATFDAVAATRAGLRAARAMHERGLVWSADVQAAPSLPLDAATTQLLRTDDEDGFHLAHVPPEDDWRIFTAASPREFRVVAGRVAVEGDGAVTRGLPVERMGEWSSMDRTEIESIRSVRAIIREYLGQAHRTRPLSIAVFGPPGSGKSFAIKQMAREWTGGVTKIAVLEFNLSQFASPDDLPAALQRVRDCAVEQTLPLVFWDEFDTRLDGAELGWLVRFLAPMQDGAFLEHGAARPIGPAVFVFAGGTHSTMASFKTRAVELPGAKATDFLSRLRGYVDILGPNPADERDRSFVLRRALLFRSLLSSKTPHLLADGRLEIDPGVLRAFLEVPTYIHGARSMESVIDMSALTARLRYERSSLPAPHQLALHVDADAFLHLVHAPDYD